MEYIFLGIGIVLILLVSFIGTLFILALWATSSTYIGCQSNEELDEEVAKHMGYKNYPFMDMYDD
jgi:hypothetical protein